MRKLGYLRVSTQEQRPDRQIDALEALCDELFIEVASASNLGRPIFDTVLNKLEPLDCLVVLDLDRAFRSTLDAVQTAEDLRTRKIDLKIVSLNVDTGTPEGMLVYTVLSACAQFERQLLSKRTKEGLAAAKKRGAKLGRPQALSSTELSDAAARINVHGHKVKDVAASYGVAPWSLTRAIKRALLTESRQ